MSDLQCAATFLVLPVVPALSVEQMLAARPACLYSEAGVDVEVLARDLAIAARDLPTSAAPVTPATLTAAFTDLADEFRGETLAVVENPIVEIDGESQRWRRYE